MTLASLHVGSTQRGWQGKKVLLHAVCRCLLAPVQYTNNTSGTRASKYPPVMNTSPRTEDDREVSITCLQSAGRRMGISNQCISAQGPRQPMLAGPFSFPVYFSFSFGSPLVPHFSFPACFLPLVRSDDRVLGRSFRLFGGFGWLARVLLLLRGFCNLRHSFAPESARRRWRERVSWEGGTFSGSHITCSQIR